MALARRQPARICPVVAARPPSVDTEAPVDPVTATLRAYQAAVFAKDVPAFAALYDQDVLVFDRWGPWLYRGIDAWRSVAQAWFVSLGADRLRVAFEEPTVQITADLAAVHALLRYTAVTDSGQTLYAQDQRMTWVLRPTAAGWKIVHQHSSAPVDFASGQVEQERHEPDD